jgi:hypothetical protein
MTPGKYRKLPEEKSTSIAVGNAGSSWINANCATLSFISQTTTTKCWAPSENQRATDSEIQRSVFWLEKVVTEMLYSVITRSMPKLIFTTRGADKGVRYAKLIGGEGIQRPQAWQTT